MQELTIGRLPENDVVIESNSVSRKHCRIFIDNNRYYIVDNNSTNGVYLSGQRITTTTEFFPDTIVTIGDKTFKGSDLIEKLLKARDVNIYAAQCKQLYDECLNVKNRYLNNVDNLKGCLNIASEPFSKLFKSDEEKLSYMIGEYNEKIDAAMQMLGLISKSSMSDNVIMQDNILKLSSICQKAPMEHKEVCFSYRQKVCDLFDDLQNSVANDIQESITAFANHFNTYFDSFYETSADSCAKWQSIGNKRIITSPFILYCSKRYDFPFFTKRINYERYLFAEFLRRKNIVVKYNNESRNSAFSLVNSTIARVLAASQSGNVKIHMVDIKDFGGTSNILKILDKKVMSISARPEDARNVFAMLDKHVENVIQNMLQGSLNSLEQYNEGKENQESYNVVIIKDFPYGLSQDSAAVLMRILSNGISAGIHFVFMLNESIVEASEDSDKFMKLMHFYNVTAQNAEVFDLVKQSSEQFCKLAYTKLSDEQIENVVQYVNSGFEMKKDEVLRLTDYMIPKEEWWTKHSANRVDIPFGIASNKQIQKLNITQESGQNCAMVIGIPGSGKSVFLHVLIANAMVNYSPRELQMYLLDFSGVEFDVYARHNLPHARVIAPEAEREFGLSILREIYEEGSRRMTLCRDNGVTNIVELKQKQPSLVVPRLLVIIDEFQKIFEIDNDKISKEANSIIHAIIQEYRKFGINLILATQKLPAKSVVPYDLIANRVVFKSDPVDFNNLIKWPFSTPQPRLLTGSCIYNNESGSDLANVVARSFFINASAELETLLNEVTAFASAHSEQTCNTELRTFRSDDLPLFVDRVLSERHIEHQDVPREVGVYFGESIAISDCHVYVPLTKDSNNNILIIGGESEVAKTIAYHTLLSEVAGHTEKSSNVILLNLLMDDDPVNDMFRSDMFLAVSDFCNMQIISTPEEVKQFLTYIKEDVIDARKNDPSISISHFFLNIFEFQRGRMFDGVGRRGDMQSECAQLLEYILKNGPMFGVFTVLQVDNLTNLNKLGYSAHNLFNYRIALQMPESDSEKLIGNQAANKLRVQNRPSSRYRALCYDNTNSTLTKFKPYKYES